MKTSLAARAVSACFALKRKPSAKETEAALERARRRGEKPPAPPHWLPARYADRVFYVNESSASDRTIFYLHGGAFQNDFSPFHWRFLRKLVKRTDARLVAPAYRLIPFGDCAEAFGLIVPLYRDYVREHPEKKIVLMGDSSGGLALALAEEFARTGLRMPDELILLSPWVDVSLENPALERAGKNDPWETVPRLKVCGKRWAPRGDVHDRRASPIFGDVSGLAHVTVFLGARELFYPDVIRFFERLAPADNELIVGPGMLHVYPILPIPEARRARRIIADRILR